MGKRGSGKTGNGDGDGQLPILSDHVLAEFELDTTHCMVVPALKRHETDTTIGEFRLGDACYCVIQRELPLEVKDSGGSPGFDSIESDPMELLTVREQQIVRLICFGQVNKQIAHRLSISEYTVKTYLKQIFMKLNVHSRAAMVYQCAKWVGATPMDVMSLRPTH